jgi:hypothetical protein
MAAIHLIDRADNTRKTDRSRNEWESGRWNLAEDTARKLVGATLYLHRSKNQPSHFGGRILSYRVEQADQAGSGIVFTVRAAADCKNVKTDTKGWSNDCRIVWDPPEPAGA